MLSRLAIFTVAAAFIWPGALVAQEEEMADEGTPPMLVISSWKCDWSDMGALGQDWDERAINAAQSAVDNSTWNAAGVFYHSWGDEWNIHYWATGEDIPALLEGQEANNAAYEEMYPEGLNPWDHCSEHKDGFYQLAQNASGPEDAPPGPEMAISSWQCTDVGAVNSAWEDYYRAKAQAVVDAGQWNEVGVFYHAWADEWNVNFYYFGEDIASIIAGWEAYVGSMGDDAPDLNEWCSEHKDGFYTFGDSALPSEEM